MCRISLMDVASAAKYLISYINGEEYKIFSFKCVLKNVNGKKIKKYALVICKEDSRDMVEAAVTMAIMLEILKLVLMLVVW